jgi:hypothetical protein
MTEEQCDTIEAAIGIACRELDRSPRGKRVKAQLRKFLDGDACSLDGDHWDSVEALIKFYRAGFKGTVLEEMK